MHISSLWFNTTPTDRHIQSASDTIAFVLTDAIAQIAGFSGAGIDISSQDHTLSDSSMTAAIAQEVYVGN